MQKPSAPSRQSLKTPSQKIIPESLGEAPTLACWTERAQKEMKQNTLDSLTPKQPEPFSLKPLYTSADLETLETLETLPGFPPFLRGVRATMYAGKPWTIRQYAGFSTAEESNAFYHQCLADGQTALSVAFDLATHRGYDSDHPRVTGDVGKAGVAIDTVEDMKRLFDGIDLSKISVSMTMNGAVLPILAFYIVAAEEQGTLPAQLSGTIQNDILKEFLVRNTYIYPPEPSMKIIGDIIAYAAKNMPKFNAISISGYHMHEAGATATQELAYTLANGLEYVRTALKTGLDIDDFAPRLSFFFGIGMNFFMEIAKLRAARFLWARLMQPFSPKNPQSFMLRTHCQTSGVSLSVQDPYNNVVRTTLEALAAVLGGTQSLHTNALDEALGLPTVETARIARHTQLILAEETGITDVIDPLGGSYYIESLTQSLIQAAQTYIDEIESLGGMTKAIQQGLPKSRIEEAAARRQIRLDQGEDTIVGVNKYISDAPIDMPVLNIDADFVRQQQIDRLQYVKDHRNAAACQEALDNLTKAAASGSENLLDLAIQAARHRATVGEISHALEDVFGRYKAPMKAIRHIWGASMQHDDSYQKICQRVEEFAQKKGRQPRILLVKLGQDGHDRGIKIVASAFADCGFDVDLAPLFLTPEEAANHGIENDVHLIGVSSLVAGHTTLIPRLIQELRHQEAQDIHVICGGILPPKDHQLLIDAGVKLIFTPGAPILKIIADTLEILLSSTS